MTVEQCNLIEKKNPAAFCEPRVCRSVCVVTVYVSPLGFKARKKKKSLWFLLTRWQRWQVIPGQTKRPPRGWSVSKIAVKRILLSWQNDAVQTWTESPCCMKARAIPVATGFLILKLCTVNMQHASVWRVDPPFDSSTVSGSFLGVTVRFCQKSMVIKLCPIWTLQMNV